MLSPGASTIRGDGPRAHPRLKELKRLEGFHFQAVRREDSEKADRYARSSLIVARVVFGKDKTRLIPYLDRMAGMDLEFGRFSKAIRRAREALALSRGASARVRASLLARLGHAYFGKSDFERAQEHFLSALRLVGARKSDFAAALRLALGRTYSELGKHREARKLLELVLAPRHHGDRPSRPRLKNDYDFIRERALLEIAAVHEKLNETEKSRQYYEKALREGGGDKHQSVLIASIYNRLGLLFSRAGDFVQAELYLKAALRTVLAHGNIGRLLAGKVYDNLAILHFKRSEYGPAENYWQRALIRVGPDAREERIILMTRLALLDERRGRMGRAAERLRKAGDLIIRYRTQLGRHGSGFTGRFAPVFRKLVALELKRGRNEAAFRADMYRRGLSIAEGMSLKAALERGGIPPNLGRRVLENDGSMRALIARRKAALISGRRARAEKLMRTIWQRERASAKLEKKLLRDYPAYARIRNTRVATASHISKALRENELFLSYVLMDSRTHVFVIAPGGPLKVLELSREGGGNTPACPDVARTTGVALDNFYTLTSAPPHLRGPFARIEAGKRIILWNQGKDFEKYREKDGKVFSRSAPSVRDELMAARRTSGFVGVAKEDLNDDLAATCARQTRAFLRERLLEPVLRLYGRAERLIIVPDGPAYRTPFASLLRKNSKRSIVMVHSGAVWLGLRRMTRKHGKRKILAVGDALYAANTRSARNRAAKRRPARKFLVRSPGPALLRRLAAMRATRSGFRELNRLRWNNLPGTRQELHIIARMAYANSAERKENVLAGLAANRARILSLNSAGTLSEFQYLHFALHGLFVDGNPDLNALVLSIPRVARRIHPAKLKRYEARYGPYGTDAYLRMDDIRALRLNADLVVLSACETSLGLLRAGEGMVALPQAFLIAGARNVVASLWPVEDKVAVRMMTLLYQNLFRGGLSPVESLHAAQQQLRREYPDPYHWQAFVIYGE